jgi:hypothetical protein
MYYAPSKDIADGGSRKVARKTDSVTKVKSVSRGIKARVTEE